jgi:superfamily II DNA or RNA helicase
MYQTLKKCIQFLAGRCDGAISRDGVGFQGCDTNFGHFLARQDTWKLKWAVKAHKLLKRYKNTQLPLIGVNYDEIPVPVDEEWTCPPKPVCTINDLEGADWSEPRFVAKVGKNVEEAPIPAGFWDLWKAKKAQLKALGYSCSRYTGEWMLTRWTAVEPEPVEETIILTDAEIFESVDLDPLYDYQRPHAKKLIKALAVHGVALDGSGTGTGKTYTNCVVARESHLRPLIICPKAVIPGWVKTVDALGMDYLGIANYALARNGKMRVQNGTYARGNNKGFPKYEAVDCPYITRTVNPNSGAYEPKYIYSFDLPEDGVIIFDEGHRCKNRDTQNAQLMRAARESGCKMLILTATLASSPLKMDATGYALKLHESKWDFYSWARDHGAYKSRFGWVFNNSKTMIKKIHDSIYGAGKGSRMDVATLIEGGKFPTSKILAETFNMNGATTEINKIYTEMRKELAKIEEKEQNMSNIPLAIRQKARQKVEILKVPFMVDMATDLIDEGYSVVIFVNYTATLEALCQKLKTRCTIYGGNNATTNESNRQAFQANKEHVIICNVAAAREGIDLHDEHGTRQRISIITPDDNAQNVKQCLGRVHRAGGTASQQYIVFAADTIEEKVCANVRRKINNIDVLNDGDLDIKFQF